MVFPKARAVVAGLLFLGWLGFLLLLVLQSRQPIVLSRPQFLVATLYVEAELSDDNGKPAPLVVINYVAWSADQPAPVKEGQKLDIVNLGTVGAAEGYRGPGRYLVPLWQTQNVFAIPPIPPAPGQESRQLRIYPATPETRAQLDMLVAAKAR